MYYHHPRPLQLLTMRPITHKYYVWRASFGNLIFSIYLITVSLSYFLIRFSWEISENILFSTGGRSTIFKGTVHVNSIDPLFKEGQADSQRKPLNLFLKKTRKKIVRTKHFSRLKNEDIFLVVARIQNIVVNQTCSSLNVGSLKLSLTVTLIVFDEVFIIKYILLTLSHWTRV